MIRSEEDEQTRPIPAGTLCRAECAFHGESEYAHDLPFAEGDTLRIVGPCNKIYWYLAEDCHGRRGVVPINHLWVVDGPADVTATIAPPPADRPPVALPPVDRPPIARPSVAPLPEDRPPVAPPPADRPPVAPPPADWPVAPPPAGQPSVAPTIAPSSREGDYSFGERPFLPPPEQQPKNAEKAHTVPPTPCKYPDVLAFRAKSGWCAPSVDEVLMKKAQFSNMILFQKLRVGTYVFIHKSIPNLKFVGKSYELYYELCRLFENIYSKPISHLSPIEEQLRFHHPDASEWHLRIYSCRMDELDLALAKRIVSTQSLAPRGLNRELMFAGQEAWEEFCKWFMEERKEQPRQ